MKKVYMIPAVQVLHTSTETLIAASLKLDSTKVGDDALMREDVLGWDIWSGEAEAGSDDE